MRSASLDAAAPEWTHAASGRQARATVARSRWGWLPALCLTSACGLLILALADTAARANQPAADGLFWLGLLVLFAPVAWRLLSPIAAAAERVALLEVLGVALLFVKTLAYPLGFSAFDEFIDWRTAADIFASGHLFAPNSLLPISASYPGLEIATTALAHLTGLSLFHAGLVILLAGRVLLIGSLYAFFVLISRSPYLAGLAVLGYLLNPHFVFFEAQFAYESLALPLGACVLYLVAVWARAAPGSGRTAPLGLAALMLAALGVTHHLTSYAVVGFLALWAVVAACRPGARRLTMLGVLLAVASMSLAVLLLGLLAVRAGVVAYVAPHLTQSLGDVVGALTGHGPAVRLFQSYGGPPTPAWETLAGAASVALVTLSLPVALRGAQRRAPRPTAAALCLVGLALAYPITQLLRLSASGTEIADRLPDVLFVAVGFALALAVAELAGPATAGRKSMRIAPPPARQLALTAALALALVGGVCIGAGPAWMRLPGPSLVAADARSIEPQHVRLASWMLQHLGAGHAVATDRDTRLVVETNGAQDAVTAIGNGVEVSPIFTQPTVNPTVLRLLRAGRVRYVVVDTRLCQALPAVGIYFETDEPGAYAYTAPLACAALAKFDGAAGSDRIYDDGQLVIYDTGALLYEP